MLFLFFLFFSWFTVANWAYISSKDQKDLEPYKKKINKVNEFKYMGEVVAKSWTKIDWNGLYDIHAWINVMVRIIMSNKSNL